MPGGARGMAGRAAKVSWCVGSCRRCHSTSSGPMAVWAGSNTEAAQRRSLTPTMLARGMWGRGRCGVGKGEGSSYVLQYHGLAVRWLIGWFRVVVRVVGSIVEGRCSVRPVSRGGRW